MVTSMVLELVIVLGLMVCFIVVAFFIIRAKVQGRIVVFFIESNKTMTYRMFKPKHRLFTFTKRKEDEEAYIIDTEKVVLIKFPFVGPGIIKQTVPCLIYARNNPEPLDPSEITLAPKGRTAKEIASIVNENIIDDIVRATKAEMKREKVPAWLISAVCVILVLVVLVMLFMMKSDIGNLKNLINSK